MTKNHEYFINEPEGAADATIIWLHGLGADGRDFAGIVDELGLPLNHKVRFIFPSAPFENITINQGMRMRAWYDIYNLNLSNQRASAVKAYLDAKGLNGARFVTQGMGEADPIASNETDAGRAENRRVEFAITANEKMIEDAKKEAGQ